MVIKRSRDVGSAQEHPVYIRAATLLLFSTLECYTRKKRVSYSAQVNRSRVKFVIKGGASLLQAPAVPLESLTELAAGLGLLNIDLGQLSPIIPL